MLGFHLILQDDEGQYANSAHTLKFEGSMFIYDPQRDIAQWVPVWEASASLTMMELCTANDLNNMMPSPYEGVEPIRQPSPQLVKGIPAGAKSDMDSMEGEDSGDEWDKKESSIWSCCPSPPTKVGPTWVEVHATAQEQEVLDKQTTTLEDMVSKHLPGGMEEENWDEEDHEPTGSQLEDAPVTMKAGKEEFMEESEAEEPPVEHSDEATVGPGSQNVVQIHAGEDDLQIACPSLHASSWKEELRNWVLARNGHLL